MTLAPPNELLRAHQIPGQYIEIQGSSRGYFVLASEVGAPRWQLLVRAQGGVSDELSVAPEGTSFEVSAPLGEGFPLERVQGRALTFAVVGSALGAARPMVRARLARREGGATRLYLGARTVDEVPLFDEVTAWARDGVRVVVCLSRESAAPSGAAPMRWDRGYVQDVLARDLRAESLEPSRIFAVGPTAMIAALRELAAVHAGAEVHTNA